MTVRYLLFVCLTLFLTAFLGYGTYNTAKLLRTWTPDRNLLLLPGETIVRLILIGVCIGLGILSGLAPATLGWTAHDLDRQILWGMGWGVVVAGIFTITTRWLTAATGRRFYSDTVIQHIVPHDADELLWVTLAMVPVVVLEELLFRSLLLGGLTPLLAPWLLVVGAAILFGAMHSPQGAWGVLGASLAGMVFGLLFFQAGSIVLPAVAHYVTNMLQIGFVRWAGVPETEG
ncbi:MAG: CPBP family intramembrane metalloprotease [Caldilineaceae bacterium]|nr:CPBP family intramembrane metalloprotease [Caldilineaceae bacterium]MCB9159653.1 CPBP family intramembrane metalloprotease [Caldilineaceae bacterium]